MARFNSSDCYGIIGVGYFGSSVAKALAQAGKTVIAVDINPAPLKELSSTVYSVCQITQISKESLEEAGLRNCGTVIICIGEHLEASILATLNCIELGVPRVISKAGSEDHGLILSKLGAEVIFPEVESGSRLAHSLCSKANLDLLPLSKDFSIISVDVNPIFIGKNILDLGWRRKYDVNIIAIIKDGAANASISPEYAFEKGDRVVLCGTNAALDRFNAVNEKGLE